MGRQVPRQLVLALAFTSALAGCRSLSRACGCGSTVFGHTPPQPAQEDEAVIEPDRPDRTNAAYTVPPALVQVESGGRYTPVRATGEMMQTPSTVRAGVNNWLEFRIDTDGITRVKQPQGTSTQVGATSLGGKLRLWAAPAELVVTIEPGITLPSGAGQHGTDFSLTVITGRDLTSRAQVDANYTVGTSSTSTARAFQQMLSVSANASATTKWQPYVEVYWISRADGGAPLTSTDAGATYVLNRRFALDGGIDFGLSDVGHRPTVFGGASVIVGEVAGHRGVANRLREAQARGDR